MSITFKSKKNKEEFYDLVLPDTIVGYAKTYLNADLQPVPLHEGEAPVEGFKHSKIESINHDSVDQWFAQASGIALRCGTHGGGLIVFDLDCPEAVKLAPSLLPPTGLIWGRKGEPSHYAYRLESGAALLKQEFPKSNKGTKALVEILGEASTGTANLCTVPPSKKPDNGDSVAFASAQLPLPEMSLADAKRLGARLATASCLLRHYPEKGTRHLYSVAAYGALWNAGWTLEDTLAVNKAVSKAAGDEEDRTGDVHSAFKLGKAGGDVTGWPVFSEMLGDDAGAAYEVALRAGEQPKSDEPEVDWTQRFVDMCHTPGGWKGLSLPPPHWLVDEFLHAETNNILFGAQKTGKSYLLLWLAYRLATGKDFFHWHTPKAAKVLYIDAELPPSVLKDRMMKVVPEDTDNLRVFPLKLWRTNTKAPPMNLNSQGAREILNQVIEKLKPDLLILDNAFELVLGINKQSDQDWEPTMKWLQDWNGRGLTTLMVCHVAKGKEGDSAFGSVVQMAKANTTRLTTDKETGFMILTPWESNHMHTNKKKGTMLEQVHDTEVNRVYLKELGETTDEDEEDIAILAAIANGWSGGQNKLAGHLGIKTSTMGDKMAKLKTKKYLKPGKGITAITEDGIAYLKQNGGYNEDLEDGL